MLQPVEYTVTVTWRPVTGLKKKPEVTRALWANRRTSQARPANPCSPHLGGEGQASQPETNKAPQEREVPTTTSTANNTVCPSHTYCISTIPTSVYLKSIQIFRQTKNRSNSNLLAALSGPLPPQSYQLSTEKKIQASGLDDWTPESRGKLGKGTVNSEKATVLT